MKMASKAQIKMFETIAVLVIFFFLLVVGSAFYFGAQRSALEKEKAVAAEKAAFQVVLRTLNLPELDCSFLATQKDNCIDKIKLAKLSGILREDENALLDYFGTFGYSTITVRQVWPVFGMQKTVLYNNTPEEEVSAIASFNPILLFDAIGNSYDFGVIEVKVYVG